MFKHCTQYIAAGMLGLVFLFPANTYAQSSTAEEAYRAYLLQVIELLQAQIQALQAQLVAEQATTVVLTGGLSAEVDMVSLYSVSGLADASRIPDTEERAYFMRVATLVPDEYDQRFAQLGIFDGGADFDAFVETLAPKHETWLYAAHEDLLSDPIAEWNTELIVHELAHVLSLDAVPGLVASKYYECADGMAVTCCPPADSYVGQFIKKFWSDGQIAESAEVVRRNRTEQYYKAHDDAFVSEYAVTAPEEDFADSFMFYVLEERTSGAIAKEKIAFFSDYKIFRDAKAHVASVE